ncbi:MAG: hypothetical protein O6829_09295 [Alphaproteobacteria bacterium]|nr:hypothetical protein [Alphaproteobacteria bacterium]
MGKWLAPLAGPVLAAAVAAAQAPGTWLPLRVRRGAETVDIVARFPPTP